MFHHPITTTVNTEPLSLLYILHMGVVTTFKHFEHDEDLPGIQTFLHLSTFVVWTQRANITHQNITKKHSFASDGLNLPVSMKM